MCQHRYSTSIWKCWSEGLLIISPVAEIFKTLPTSFSGTGKQENSFLIRHDAPLAAPELIGSWASGRDPPSFLSKSGVWTRVMMWYPASWLVRKLFTWSTSGLREFSLIFLLLGGSGKNFLWLAILVSEGVSELFGVWLPNPNVRDWHRYLFYYCYCCIPSLILTDPVIIVFGTFLHFCRCWLCQECSTIPRLLQQRGQK